MKNILVLAIALGAFACSKSKEDRVADEFRAFADRMCACDSDDCKREVRRDYRAWEKSDAGKLFGEARGAWIDEVEAKIKRGCRGPRRKLGQPRRLLWPSRDHRVSHGSRAFVDRGLQPRRGARRALHRAKRKDHT